MRYGVYLYPPSPKADPGDVVTLAREAERIGYESAWLGDHVAWPVQFDPETHHRDVGGRTPGPAVVDVNVFEPLTTLSFVAALTERIRLGLGVLIAAYRHPLLTAKMLAMLDVLSGGRLTVGVGAGWLREEFELLSAPPFEHRGSVTSDHVRAYLSLWTEERPQFDGAYATIGRVAFNPKPLQKPHPPVWIGGNGDAAIRRAAELGDGWMPLHQTPDQIAGKVRRLRELEHEIRRGRAVDVSVACRFRFADRPGDPDTLVGDRQHMIDQLRHYRDAGVGEVHLLNDGYGSVPDLIGAWERFATEVIPGV